MEQGLLRALSLSHLARVAARPLGHRNPLVRVRRIKLEIRGELRQLAVEVSVEDAHDAPTVGKGGGRRRPCLREIRHKASIEQVFYGPGRH